MSFKLALGQLRHCYGNAIKGYGVDVGLIDSATAVLQQESNNRFTAINLRLAEYKAGVERGDKAFGKDVLSKIIETLEIELDKD